MNSEPISTFKISTFTIDANTPTVISLKFITPEILPTGIHQTTYDIDSSNIILEFKTSDGTRNFFATDLGTGLSCITQSCRIPCYGITSIECKIKLFPLIQNISIKWN